MLRSLRRQAFQLTLQSKGMVKKIHEASFVAQRVFGIAGFMKRNLPWPFGSIADKVVFSKVKAATGGRLRLAMNGGMFTFESAASNADGRPFKVLLSARKRRNS